MDPRKNGNRMDKMEMKMEMKTIRANNDNRLEKDCLIYEVYKI
jgi:hypothetical protein